MPQTTDAVTTTGFGGAQVAVFESRMAEAMAKSIVSHGGEPIRAPTMREVPLEQNHEALAFGEALLGARVDVLICLTGVGTRLLLETLATRHERARVIEAMSRLTVVARGPKPIRVLKEYGIPVTIAVPEPNTWHELVQTLDLDSRSLSLEDRTVAIQEYGVSNTPLIQALKARGARVMQVPVYRWALPEDTAPLREAIRRIVAGSVDCALFTNAIQIAHVIRVAAEEGLEQPLREACSRMVVASVGPTTSDALIQHGLAVDFAPTHPKMGPLIDELAAQAASLMAAKRQPQPARARDRAPREPGEAATRRESVFLKACRLEPTPFTPVWIMRQAGRYLKAYRDIRNKVPFLELCKRKELVAELTVMAAKTIGADAAILFSDILLVVEPLGLGLEYREEEGPVITGQVAALADIDRMPELKPEESLAFVFDAVRETRAALPAELPLIGFSGAPFTIASYLIEGGSSKAFVSTKRLMYGDPGAWRALMEKIARGLTRYLNDQMAAGVDAVQVFDTWVGCLGPRDYREFVLPYTKQMLHGLTRGVPVIHFGVGTGAFLEAMREAGGDVIGVDHHVELDQAWQVIGSGVGIQGNLDPVALYGSRTFIRARVTRILEQAGGRPGHIFNLGHGVLPTTPEEHVKALVDEVHELSVR